MVVLEWSDIFGIICNVGDKVELRVCMVVMISYGLELGLIFLNFV